MMDAEFEHVAADNVDNKKASVREKAKHKFRGKRNDNSEMSFLKAFVEFDTGSHRTAVSTRFIGLSAHLSALECAKACNFEIGDETYYSLIRASYVAFDVALSFVHHNTSVIPEDLIDLPKADRDVEDALKSRRIFRATAEFIQRLGVIESEGKIAVPYVENSCPPISVIMATQDGASRRTVNLEASFPEELRITSLRSTMAVLADTSDASLAFRSYFINHLPFYLEVNDNHIDPTVLDTICPSVYGKDQMIKDIKKLENVVKQAANQYKGRLVLEKTGCLSQLINVKNNDIKATYDGVAGGYDVGLQIDSGSFVENEYFSIGMYFLFGEIPHPPKTAPSISMNVDNGYVLSKFYGNYVNVGWQQFINRYFGLVNTHN